MMLNEVVKGLRNGGLSNLTALNPPTAFVVKGLRNGGLSNERLSESSLPLVVKGLRNGGLSNFTALGFVLM